MAPHSSTLAWKIPWMEEPGGLQSMRSHRVRHDGGDLACMHALEKEMATHSSVLAWRIPGTGEPVGLPSMGSHRVGQNWSDLAAAAAAAVAAAAYSFGSNNKKIKLLKGKLSMKQNITCKITQFSLYHKLIRIFCPFHTFLLWSLL